MEAFVDLLLQERSLLSLAVYRMETLHHYVQGTNADYVEIAANEASTAIVKLHQIESARAAELAKLAESLGESAKQLSLRRLRELRPKFAPLLDELQRDFLKLTDHLTGLTRSTRRVAQTRSHEVERVLRMIIGEEQSRPINLGVARTEAARAAGRRVDGVV